MELPSFAWSHLWLPHLHERSSTSLLGYMRCVLEGCSNALGSGLDPPWVWRSDCWNLDLFFLFHHSPDGCRLILFPSHLYFSIFFLSIPIGTYNRTQLVVFICFDFGQIEFMLGFLQIFLILMFQFNIILNVVLDLLVFLSKCPL